MWEEISAHLYKHLKIARRWPGELAHLFVYPTISLLSLGILAFFLIMNGAPLSAMMFVFVGVLMWNVYDMAQRIMSYGITLDIWNECLRHSFVGASRIRHFIIGNLIYGAIGAVIGLVIVAIAGIFVFGFDIFSGGIFLAANMAFVFVFGAGIGMMIDALMLTRGSKYMAVIWIIPGIIMILSGVYYPPELLPPGVFEVSMALPSTHCISSLRAAVLGAGGSAMAEFLTGSVLAAVYFIAGGILFRLGLKKGRENGVITKY